MIAVIRRGLALFLLTGLARAQAPAPAPAAASATATAAKPAVGSLRVAIDPHAPPFAYLGGDKISGLEVEFARGLGEVLKRPVEFVATSTQNLIPTLLDNKADIIMSGFAINRLRLVRVSFTNPYLRVGQLALCRREDVSIYVNNVNLQNVRGDVGVVTGSTGDLLMNTQFSFAGHRQLATYDDAIAALLAKKVDLVLADIPVAIWESSQNEATIAIVPNVLSQEDVAWAVRKDDDALRAVANAYLEQLRVSGKLAELVHKWVPDAAPETIAPGSTPPAPAPASASGTAPAAASDPAKK